MSLKLSQSIHVSKYHQDELIRKTNLNELRKNSRRSSSHISKLFLIIINLLNR